MKSKIIFYITFIIANFQNIILRNHKTSYKFNKWYDILFHMCKNYKYTICHDDYYIYFIFENKNIFRLWGENEIYASGNRVSLLINNILYKPTEKINEIYLPSRRVMCKLFYIMGLTCKFKNNIPHIDRLGINIWQIYYNSSITKIEL